LLERDSLRAAPPSTATTVLRAALTCASGHEAPPSRDRTAALLQRLAEAGPVVATLGGARVEAGARVLIVREAGERSRGGLASVYLPPEETVVWDGRFEIESQGFAGEIGPLAGRMNRVVDKEALGRLPAPARGGLPGVIMSDGTVTCPVLARRPGLTCRSLAGERLLAACGVIAREVE
jgi:tRNA(Ile)-lysidine synthase